MNLMVMFENIYIQKPLLQICQQLSNTSNDSCVNKSVFSLVTKETGYYTNGT